jgi:serine/threonine protein kinase
MEVFGRYQLHERIGQGGMGVVYRAFDTVLERVVALKLVQAPTELDAELRERFFREARAAGHLSHPNIVTIYDLGEHDGRPYIAMEYLDGEDLQKRLARPERMSLRRRLDLAIEICQSIEYAHSRGIVHRDLKPANVYLSESGTAKILDFGLARLMTSQLTQSNMLMGTLNYMAPEQVRGERADQRSDIFSMGVVLYELFGGRRAFEGDSVASTLYKILEVTPEPLSRIDPALPLDLTVIVERAMAKLRDERYSEMTSLRVDLEMFRQQHLAAGPVTPVATPLTPGRASVTGPNAETVLKPSVAPPIAAAPASRSRSGVAVAVAALVLTAAAVLWVFSRKEESPRPSPPPVANAAPPANPDAVLAQAPQDPDAGRTRDAARRGTPARVHGSSSDADAARTHVAEGRSAAAPADAPAVAVPAPAAATRPVIPSAPPVEPPAIGAPQSTAAPPVPPPAAVNPPPAEEAAQPTGAEDRITDLVGRYKEALESRNLDQVKRLWPSLGGAAETALRQEFAHARQIAVGITDRRISVSGNAGSVSFVRTYGILTVEGQRLQSTSQAVMDVRRAGGSWVIDSIHFSPR